MFAGQQVTNVSVTNGSGQVDGAVEVVVTDSRRLSGHRSWRVMTARRSFSRRHNNPLIFEAIWTPFVVLAGEEG